MTTFRNMGKQFRAVPTQTPTKIANRTRRFVLSNSGIALDGHTLATSGVDLSRAANGKLPMPSAHDTETVEHLLGGWTNIHIRGDDLLGDAEFMDGGINELSDRPSDD